MKKLLFIGLCMFSQQVFAAWDGVRSGKVANIDVTGGNNYGFRVWLGGVTSMCGNDHGWAYINELDSNYQVYVSVLLAAKMAERTVVIYTTQTGSNGYCHIGYMGMR